MVNESHETMTNATEVKANVQRCGVVALVGRPNVGKSSLVNALLKEHAAIVSPKPQTTRNAVRCIYNGHGAQIIFVDTPGLFPIHATGARTGERESNVAGRDRGLNEFLVSSAIGSLEDADAACWLVEAGDRKLRDEDIEVQRVLAEAGLPVVLVVNKADLAGGRGDGVTQVFELYGKLLPFVGKLAISAKLQRGVDALVEMLLPLIPEGEPLYDPDVLMDTTERFVASETIRGQVLKLLRDEVPHCTAVEIESYKSPDEFEFHDQPERPRGGNNGAVTQVTPKRREKLYIRASLVVETEGQKAILIGAKGAMIRKIGQCSRAELEKITGWPVYLELWVKVSPHWRQTDLVLRRLGYSD